MNEEEAIKQIKERKAIQILKETHQETKKTMLTLMMSAFSLVAALAWNDAIQTFFNTYFPKNSGLIGKFLYAILITFIVVVVSLQTKKLLDSDVPQDSQQ